MVRMREIDVDGEGSRQRLMLTEDKSAKTAAFAVGYESPAQFNREYKR
jgi:AraC-like DNA-binding protein